MGACSRYVRSREHVVCAERLEPGLAPKSPFEDAERETICEPMRAPDGAIRCVPEGTTQVFVATAWGWYADALCLQPLVLCGHPCEGQDVVVRGKGGLDVVPVADRLHAIGQAAASVFVHDGRSCIPVSSPGTGLRQLGPEISWDKHPRLDEWRGNEVLRSRRHP